MCSLVDLFLLHADRVPCMANNELSSTSQVITGAVHTNFITNQPGTEVAPGSIYAPAKESIENVMNGKAVAKNFVDADVYAREVVANVLRKRPVKRQWAGGVARLIWAVSAMLWATVWVS